MWAVERRRSRDHVRQGGPYGIGPVSRVRCALAHAEPVCTQPAFRASVSRGTYNSHRRSVTLILLGAVVIVLACPLVGGILSVLAEPPGRLRSAFGILLVLGFSVAIWATFFVEYQTGP